MKRSHSTTRRAGGKRRADDLFDVIAARCGEQDGFHANAIGFGRPGKEDVAYGFRPWSRRKPRVISTVRPRARNAFARSRICVGFRRLRRLQTCKTNRVRPTNPASVPVAAKRPFRQYPLTSGDESDHY